MCCNTAPPALGIKVRVHLLFHFEFAEFVMLVGLKTLPLENLRRAVAGTHPWQWAGRTLPFAPVAFITAHTCNAGHLGD